MRNTTGNKQVTDRLRWVDALYLFLYSTSQGHTVSTAIPQPVLTCFHRSLLDREVDLLIRWDNKILSHMEMEGSFLMYRLQHRIHLCSQLLNASTSDNLSTHQLYLDLDNRNQQGMSRSCPGLVWAGSCLGGRLSLWHCPGATIKKWIILDFISGE